MSSYNSGEKQLAKSSSLGSDIDKLSNTLQFYSALTKQDLGRSLDTLSNLYRPEVRPPVSPDNINSPIRSLVSSLDSPFPFLYSSSLFLSSAANSLEYINQPLTESEQSSSEEETEGSDSEEESEEVLVEINNTSEVTSNQTDPEDSDIEEQEIQNLEEQNQLVIIT